MCFIMEYNKFILLFFKISDGAEIVMLKRDFFVKYADEVCRKELRANVLHYPDISILQVSF